MPTDELTCDLYAVDFRRGPTYYVLANGYDHAVRKAQEKLNASNSAAYAGGVKCVRLIANGWDCANMNIKTNS
jgi:hypothetical protein